MTAFLAVTYAGSAVAQQIPGPYGPPVTLAQARALVDAAHRAAKARNFTMAFAVALPSGEPILLEVMDGTQSASIAISQAKARTAARFRRATKIFADATSSGNMGPLTIDDAVTVEGGVPILSNGRVIGALGVSGGTSVEDGEIAGAALAMQK
jgi:uncharacterized protein GlcG (DUF336 family)